MIKLKSLAEILAESPVKMPGDAPFETLDNRSKSETGINDDYIFISDYKKYKVFKLKNNDYIIVGQFYFDEITKKNRFGIVADLSYKEKTFRTKNKILGNKNIIEIESVHVKVADRRESIASFLYIYLLNEFHLLSDKIQYENAVKLWKRFIDETNNIIYLYDSKNDNIISKVTKNTNINSIWSEYPNFSKHKFQLLMISK